MARRTCERGATVTGYTEEEGGFSYMKEFMRQLVHALNILWGD